MRTRLYWAYALRSLTRGGPRTVLAIFCVTVGVLAIVAVQLVGGAVGSALLGDTRALNGGDLHVSSNASLLTSADLAYFNQLEAQGTISTYTAVDSQAVKLTIRGQIQTQRVGMRAVDPSRFPLAGEPVFTTPVDGTLPSLLRGDSVVITTALAQLLALHVGDSLRVTALDGRTGEFTIRGVIQSSGAFQGPVLLVNIAGYARLQNTSGQPVAYSDVYVDVPGHSSSLAGSLEQRIQQQFPLVDVQTPEQLLATEEQQVNQIRYFLQIVGLVALLIGGIGISNTMQVALRRRRSEIAMLKTAGYRQRDLYTLFGLEAGLIGLAGGLLGAVAGLGVSAIGTALVESIFQISLSNVIDPGTLGTGVVIGFMTALIFGVKPIVQASQVRPIGILRDMPEDAGWGARLLGAGLIALLGALFFAMALFIVQNLVVSGLLVIGTALVLSLLGGALWLLVWRISEVKLPDGFRWWYVPLVGIALALALATVELGAAFGLVPLAAVGLGAVAFLLPRRPKSHVKLAVRNFGRQKARAVSTLLALTVGVVSIGLVLILATDIRTNWTQSLETNTHADAVIIAHSADRAAVDRELATMPGATHVEVTTFDNNIVPSAVNGDPMPQFVQAATATGQYTPTQVVQFLRSVQGYDLAEGQAPDPTLVTIVRGAHDTHPGRSLSSSDAGTGNVLVPLAASRAPDNLTLGDTLTLTGTAASGVQSRITLTVVGFYTSNLAFGNILVDAPIVQQVGGGDPSYVYTLYLNPQSTQAQLGQIQSAAPSVWTFNIADTLAQVNDLINNLMTLLVIIASLTMLAAIIGIANAVALALLERRRELGILKAVGFTSRTVIGEVLVENALIGIVAAMLAVVWVCIVIPTLGLLLTGQPFAVPVPLAGAIILGSTVLSMVVAAVIAWHPTRVRPMEVLRYE